MNREESPILDLDFKKRQGILPCVVQEKKTKDILMVASINQEALTLTLETGIAHFFSLSRNKIWKKGETSGNLQLIKDIYVDCDQDALIYVVEAKGGACHTKDEQGEFRSSCFYRKINLDFFKQKTGKDQREFLELSVDERKNSLLPR